MSELTPQDAWPTGFMVIQGNRLEDLSALLVQWTQRYPLTPLQNEVILVQSNGIAQWLKMTLASDTQNAIPGQGVAAALQTELPGRFIWDAYRSVFPSLPRRSPFDKGPLSWRLFRLLSQMFDTDLDHSTTSILSPLVHFLQSDKSPKRIWQLAERLADLYDQYQVYRSDWLDAWENHRDIIIDAKRKSTALQPSDLWQPYLWRLLIKDIMNTEEPESLLEAASRAHVHQAFCEQLLQSPQAVDAAVLPRRVIVFGISSLPQQTLEVLEALSQHAQILLFVCNPSRHYWGDLIAGRDLFRKPNQRHRQVNSAHFRPLEEMHRHGHPLLAAWGRQGRDYLCLLDERDNPEHYNHFFNSIDLFAPSNTTHLLSQLQDDILELRSLSERQALSSTTSTAIDHSVQFLISYGPQREIEALHDYLLAEFEQAKQEKRSLKPRDILIMVPDIQRYVAHIDAVFGRISKEDPRYIPFHIADRGQKELVPMLHALELLLHLPESRFALTDMLDLLDVPSFRQRFEIADQDLERLLHWIQGANIRWGLDEEQRCALDLPSGLVNNTWRFGLKRMLLGYACGDQEAWLGTQPYEEVSGLDASIVGLLANLLDSLEATWIALRQPCDAAQWIERIRQLLKDFFIPTQLQEEQLLYRLEHALQQWFDTVQQGASEKEIISIDIVRNELLSAIEQPNMTQTYIAGSVNFATLMPMRAIPFKQIWLLGMNDGDYPRPVTPMDFDLMNQDYRPGDRSRREDDRYLFLEALLSAREKLVISWVGKSSRDNSIRSASVLVEQLRDHLAAGWEDSHPNILQALTHEHRLQPFSHEYFDPNSQLFTYAQEWLCAHQTQTSQSEAHRPSVDSPLNYALTFASMKRIFENPLNAYYNLVLKIPNPEDMVSLKNSENFDFSALERWKIKQTLLQDFVTEDASEECRFHQIDLRLRRLQTEGVLLQGTQGLQQAEDLYNQLQPQLKSLAATLNPYSEKRPPQNVLLTYADDNVSLQLQDALDSVYRNPQTNEQIQCYYTASNLNEKGAVSKKKHWLYAWITHILAHQQGLSITTYLFAADGYLKFQPLEGLQAADKIMSRMMQSIVFALQKPRLINMALGMLILKHVHANSPSDTAERTVEQWEEILSSLWLDQYDQHRLFRHHAQDTQAFFQTNKSNNSTSETFTFIEDANALYADFYTLCQTLKVMSYESVL